MRDALDRKSEGCVEYVQCMRCVMCVRKCASESRIACASGEERQCMKQEELQNVTGELRDQRAKVSQLKEELEEARDATHWVSPATPPRVDSTSEDFAGEEGEEIRGWLWLWSEAGEGEEAGVEPAQPGQGLRASHQLFPPQSCRWPRFHWSRHCAGQDGSASRLLHFSVVLTR